MPSLKTTKYKLKYYKLRKSNMVTRINSDIVELMQVYSIINSDIMEQI